MKNLSADQQKIVDQKLFNALHREDYENARMWLNEGASPNAIGSPENVGSTENAMTPLHIVSMKPAKRGRLAFMQTLLDHGADPWRLDGEGLLPIQWASRAGNWGALMFWHRFDAAMLNANGGILITVNWPDLSKTMHPVTEVTLLDWAIEQGVTLKGVTLTEWDVKGRSVLGGFFAHLRKNNSLDMLPTFRCLLDHGVSVLSPIDQIGYKTVLQWCYSFDFEASFERCLDLMDQETTALHREVHRDRILLSTWIELVTPPCGTSIKHEKAKSWVWDRIAARPDLFNQAILPATNNGVPVTNNGLDHQETVLHALAKLKKVSEQNLIQWVEARADVEAVDSNGTSVLEVATPENRAVLERYVLRTRAPFFSHEDKDKRPRL